MEKVILINATELGYQVIKSLARHNINSIVLYDKKADEIGRYSKHVSEAIEVPRYIEEPDLLTELLLKKKDE